MNWNSHEFIWIDWVIIVVGYFSSHMGGMAFDTVKTSVCNKALTVKIICLVKWRNPGICDRCSYLRMPISVRNTLIGLAGSRSYNLVVGDGSLGNAGMDDPYFRMAFRTCSIS